MQQPDRVSYRRLSGGSLERLAALSDGIFAVTLTLLVLDLRVPMLQETHRQAPLWSGGAFEAERALGSALHHVGPNAVAFALSFLTLAMFWVGQQAQLSLCAGSDRHLTWLHLAFLLGVSFMPFSTALLSEYMTVRLALLVYWLNLLVLGLLLLACLRYGTRSGLLTAEPEALSAIRRRIVIAQVLYAAAVALSVVNTYVSVTLIVLLQLVSAAGVRRGPFAKF